jgi:predicted alpha/beta-fold hydrolase
LPRRFSARASTRRYAEWQTPADRAAAAYRAGREGPIIIIGHSLGADAVMEMSAYLAVEVFRSLSQCRLTLSNPTPRRATSAVSLT